MLIYMRPHRRREPVDHILIAGVPSDLECIQAALAILPADAYGQVYIQASADTDLTLSAPARMTIHLIDDATGSLETAVAAWVAEWVPEEFDPRRRVAVWVGDHASVHVASTYQEFAGLVERL